MLLAVLSDYREDRVRDPLLAEFRAASDAPGGKKADDKVLDRNEKAITKHVVAGRMVRRCDSQL